MEFKQINISPIGRNKYIKDTSTTIISNGGGSSDNTNLTDKVNENSTDITDLKSKVSTNTSDIATLESNVNTLDQDVAAAQSDINSNTSAINVLDGKVTTNTNNITALTTTVNDIPNKYLSKVNDDTATGLITFEKGITTKDFIKSYGFTSGFSGTGFGITKSNSLYTAEADYMIIRKIFTVYEMLIARLNSVNGGIVISAANGKISKISGSYLYFDNATDFAVNDIIKCQTFNGTTIKSYLATVSAVSSDKKQITVTNRSGSASAVGDYLVQFGNTSNTSRQGIIILSSTDNKIVIYKGVNSYTLPSPKVLLSPDQVNINADSISIKGNDVESSISLKVSKEDMTYQNMLYHTNKGTKGWSLGVQNEGSLTTEAQSDGGCKFTLASDYGRWCMIQYDGLNLTELEDNTTYTLSFDAVSTNSHYMTFNILRSDGTGALCTNTQYQTIAVGTSHYYFTITTSFGDNTLDTQQVYFAGWNTSEIGNSLTISNLMMVKGDFDATYKSRIEDKLLDTGIDIQNKQIVATTDNMIVQSNSGVQTLLLDKNGQLIVTLINTDLLQTEKIVCRRTDNNKTYIASTLNDDGNGMLTYYYDNGQAMRKDTPIWGYIDDNGNVGITGCKTTYYDRDGNPIKIIGVEDGYDADDSNPTRPTITYSWQYKTDFIWWKSYIVNSTYYDPQDWLNAHYKDLQNSNNINAVISASSDKVLTAQTGSICTATNNTSYNNTVVYQQNLEGTTTQATSSGFLFTGVIFNEDTATVLSAAESRYRRTYKIYRNGSLDSTGIIDWQE